MVGSLKFLEEQVLPVDFLVESVSLDVLNAVFQVTITLREITTQKVLHEALALATINKHLVFSLTLIV